jgi:diacylglycerol kinase family enzyme
MRRRLLAVVALVAAAASLALAVAVVVSEFPRGLVVVGCMLVAGTVAWYAVLRRGPVRTAALIVAGLALAAAVVLLVTGRPLLDLLVVAGVVVALAAACATLAVDVDLPDAQPPQHPVLVYNPRSGGGKAERFALADEARTRGIEPIEFGPPWDLDALVRKAVADGADGLAMAGGDGSQAVVAAVAAETGLPYACIPSGTRNHFALDLGVDRDDVVGALDAFVDGGERIVDLAEVNGRVFVNNVSLGVYAEAVQRPGYRRAKVRTLLDTVTDVLGGREAAQRLRWTTPHGRTMAGAAVILIGNNQYRLSGAAGAGSRPAVDQGELGITVLDPPSSRGPRGRRPWRQWSAPEFCVEADRPIPAGVDGEAALLGCPVTVRIRPAALRVLIAAHHPGASPSSVEPVGALAALRALARIARGRDPRHHPPRVPPG